LVSSWPTVFAVGEARSEARAAAGVAFANTKLIAVSAVALKGSANGDRYNGRLEKLPVAEPLCGAPIGRRRRSHQKLPSEQDR
jgi:hypothetical protein